MSDGAEPGEEGGDEGGDGRGAEEVDDRAAGGSGRVSGGTWGSWMPSRGGNVVPLLPSDFTPGQLPTQPVTPSQGAFCREKRMVSVVGQKPLTLGSQGGGWEVANRPCPTEVFTFRGFQGPLSYQSFHELLPLNAL